MFCGKGGLWVEGMMDDALDTPPSKCEDSQNEKLALQHEVENRGHILIMLPKCHPELSRR